MSRIATAALAALLTAGVLAPAPAKAADKTVVVALVASSGQKAMTDVIASYEKAHPDVVIQPMYAGAQVLRAQVDAGAGDVIVVGTSTTTALGAKIESAVAVYKYHEVVEVPKGSAKVHALKDLANKGVRVVLGTADSPHGVYARTVLEKASKSYGSGFASSVLANVVVTKTAASAVPQTVVAGSADAAIGFSSDEYPGLAQIAIPEAFDVVTTTRAAAVKASSHLSAAEAFVSYLSGAEAQAIFHKHRFN